MTTQDRRPFDPRTTVFTNLALDEVMPKISPNAWKIICLAVRKTAGWKDDDTASGRKEADVISVSQFMRGTGIKGKHTAEAAIAECLQEGYLMRTPVGQSFEYRLFGDRVIMEMQELDFDFTYLPEVDDVNWLRLRMRLGLVDNVCAYCGRGPEKHRHLEVEHVHPRKHDGGNDAMNLVLSCSPCNNRKGGRTPQEANMMIRHGDTNLLRSRDF